MVSDLTGLEIANASLLDEGTAAAEAMTLCQRAMPRKSTANTFFVSDLCHPQTIAVVQVRAVPLGINVIVGDHETYDFAKETFGVLLQYPTTEGDILDYGPFAAKAHEHGALVVVAADILSLVLLRPPGEFGADVAVGNTQRFGVPMGFGGPHAAYMATMEKYKRIMPGRLIGASIDANGDPGYRLALQTREQHIRRDKATSNICTAQVLLAIMASMYAVYHGPEGLRRIAWRVRLMTGVLAAGVRQAGYKLNEAPVFDTLKISGGPRNQADIQYAAQSREINLRYYDDGTVGVTLDEATSIDDLKALLDIFGVAVNVAELADRVMLEYGNLHQRNSDFLTHPVFNT
jgi:glycine dehydrogenase